MLPIKPLTFEDNPLVSIIIPVWNSAAAIESCLDQVRVQDYVAEKIEVIVADGASTDLTVDIAQVYAANDPRFRVLSLKKGGRAYGLNAAIRVARGSIICRLDVRTRIERDYIRLCVQTLRETGAQNVGGLQVPDGQTPAQMAIGWAMAHPFGAGNAQFKIAKRSSFVDSVYLGCFRRSVFDRVGLFDESGLLISEDSDMNQRIRAAGGKIFLNTAILVGYRPRGSIVEQGKLYWRYGLARAGFARKHRRLSAWRQLVAPTFVVLCLGLSSLAPFSWWAGITLAGVLAIYMSADLLVSTRITLQHHSPRSWLTLCIVFPVMHLAWGMGFWRGLLQQQNDIDVVV